MSPLVNFHFHKRHHRLSDGEVAGDLMLATAGNQEATRKTFSDWAFYQELRNQPGCIQVELSQLHVDHSSWFLTGLQAVYRCSFKDGRKDKVVEAPLHEFQRFRYRQYGQSTRSTLELSEKEHIANCSIRRVDQISDRITIRTNLRTVSFGSPAFSSFRQNWLLPVSAAAEAEPAYSKVVALAGVMSEMSEQLGCFSESQNWRHVKDWILTRRLLEKERAQQVPPTTTDPADPWIESMILHTNDDIFKRVLSFLIPDP